MSDMNSAVDDYLGEATTWVEVIEELRRILLDCHLTEEIKWGKPCYGAHDNNVAIIQPFKDSCAVMFFKGVLLDDPDGVLEKPGPNSRVGRRIPFTSVDQVLEMEPIFRAYVEAAVEVEKAGLEVELEQNPEPIPDEFQERLDAEPDLKAAFESLTPGRQRAYILYFSGAKQSKTRKARVQRYAQKILDGKGMRD